jgi:hypothetical protein
MVQWISQNKTLTFFLCVLPIVLYTLFCDLSRPHEERGMYFNRGESQTRYVTDCRTSSQPEQTIEIPLSAPGITSGSGAGCLDSTLETIPSGGLPLSQMHERREHSVRNLLNNISKSRRTLAASHM